MDRTALGKLLNGGYIESYKFDLRRNELVLQVDVLENGVLSRFDAEFSDVSQLVFETESTSAGDRLEVTEIWVDSAPEASSSEEWTIVISMWDLTHLRIRCAAVTIDGEALR